jgi:hypothetical protein
MLPPRVELQVATVLVPTLTTRLLEVAVNGAVVQAAAGAAVRATAAAEVATIAASFALRDMKSSFFGTVGA